ncbi:L-aspartate oxidase [Andreesenia angusta]|uniref:L-aspartate oxidase n=1 Tax=Andreesenia angusta TaxID=39480 RepID=A0A1S1V4L5_9FIRM|nr:L-aspartate oxidase [Andreesenia angusta]OHW61562.1 L-aspartate oxidase [Andreesenia angusta]
MKSHYDVIVVGTGIAGLFTAINIEKKSVLLVSKSKVFSGNTPLAQGGIVSCIYKDSHFSDTVKAGSYYNKKEAVKAIEEDSRENIQKLIELGVNFERDENGELKYTREGGHSENTILYVKDRTGREIVETIAETARQRENIEILEDTMVTEIVEEGERVAGVKLISKSGRYFEVETDHLVLATGGIGELYLNTTNSAEATGDGIAIAYRSGAKVKDMEFIQFHPTSFYLESESKRFLISESLRGEGAKLINENGIRFMDNYHEMGELAPRDIVSRGIYRELSEGRKVYLDIRHESEEHLKNRFPTIYENCLRVGIDISRDLIEVRPAEHYIMGGIETDLMGNTNITGLYACGECACTGVHGGNRLASNSLLEGIVFANRIAQNINKLEKLSFEEQEIEGRGEVQGDELGSEFYNQKRALVKNIMESKLGIVRTDMGISEAIEELKSLESSLLGRESCTVEYNEILNMITVAKLVAYSAKCRKESLGAHYIERGEMIC